MKEYFDQAASLPIEHTGFEVTPQDMRDLSFKRNSGILPNPIDLFTKSQTTDSFVNNIMDGLDEGTVGYGQRKVREGYGYAKAMSDDDAESMREVTKEEFALSPFYRKGMEWREGLTNIEMKVASEMRDESEYRKAMMETVPSYGMGGVNFLMSMITMAADPLNYVPVFGVENMVAKTAIGTIAKAAALTGLEAAAQAGTQAFIHSHELERRGEAFSAVDIAGQMAGAFALGFGIRGVHAAWKLGPQAREEFNRVLVDKINSVAEGNGFASDPLQNPQTRNAADVFSKSVDGENVHQVDFSPPLSPHIEEQKAAAKIRSDIESGFPEYRKTEEEALDLAKKEIEKRKELENAPDVPMNEQKMHDPEVDKAIDNLFRGVQDAVNKHFEREALIEDIKKRCF